MRLALALGLCAALAAPAAAQDTQTLADIRQELQLVYGELLSLKRELSTTGSVQLRSSNAPVLTRIDELEEEIRRLTAQIEEAEFRIQKIVEDGTNRIGDLEFRLCELEPACDISQLDRTQPLGGKYVLPPSAPAAGASAGGGSQAGASGSATESERATFEQAMAAFERSEFAAAAEQFDALVQNFPGGPLTGEAYFWKGAALAGLEDWRGAAEAFLDSFSAAPQGVKAPDALYRLGLSLGKLGQKEEACLMLSEVPVRYPESAAAAQAKADFAALGCG